MDTSEMLKQAEAEIARWSEIKRLLLASGASTVADGKDAGKLVISLTHLLRHAKIRKEHDKVKQLQTELDAARIKLAEERKAKRRG
jgi:hypothetical protein